MGKYEPTGTSSGNRGAALSEASMPGDAGGEYHEHHDGVDVDAYQSEESYVSADMYSSMGDTVAEPKRCCQDKKPCQIKNPINFVRDLSEAFGWQFLIMLLCAYLFVKGALYTFIEVGKLPYYQNIGVTGTDYQRLAIAASTPWAMKALFGAISDATPLCGYSKSVYIVITAILGTGAFALLATVHLTTDTATYAAVMFFFGSLELAVVDLLCEGRYAALMVQRPETGAGLVTWVWACYQLGSLIAAAMVGPITDNLEVQVLFWICLPFSMQIIIPVLLGFLREDPRSTSGSPRRSSSVVVSASSASVLSSTTTTSTRNSTASRRKSLRLSVHRQRVAQASSLSADAVVVAPATAGGDEEAPATPQYESVRAAADDGADKAGEAKSSPDGDEAGVGGDGAKGDAAGGGGSEGNEKEAVKEGEEDKDENASAPRGPIKTTCLFRRESCPGARCCVLDCGKIKQQRKLFFLAVIMAMGSLGLSIASLLDNDILQITYASVSSLVLCIGAFYCLPRALAKVNLYMFLQDVLYVQIYGAMDYYYTADYACIHDGPHFSYSFYSSWSNIVGSVTGYIGVILFQTVMGKWSFRNVFWVTTIIRMAASLLDVVIVERWNIAIGIPDEWMYMLGDNIIYQVCYMLSFMPAVIITSKLAPEDMEATVYALLAGFQNFGQFVAASVGVFMISAFGIVIPASGDGGGGSNFTTVVPSLTTGASNYTGNCDFSNLSWLIVVSHFFLPMLAIPLTFVLIPDARIIDAIEIDENGNFVGRSTDTSTANKATTDGVDVGDGDGGGAGTSAALLDNDRTRNGSPVRQRQRSDRPQRPARRGPTRSKASSSILAAGAFIKRPSVQGTR